MRQADAENEEGVVAADKFFEKTQELIRGDAENADEAFFFDGGDFRVFAKENQADADGQGVNEGVNLGWMDRDGIFDGRTFEVDAPGKGGFVAVIYAVKKGADMAYCHADNSGRNKDVEPFIEILVFGFFAEKIEGDDESEERAPEVEAFVPEVEKLEKALGAELGEVDLIIEND